MTHDSRRKRYTVDMHKGENLATDDIKSIYDRNTDIYVRYICEALFLIADYRVTCRLKNSSDHCAPMYQDNAD